MIKYGSIPSSTDYDYKISDGVVTIAPGSKGYHNNGTYYVMTFPDFELLDLFKDNYYTFRISWRT